MIANVIIHLVNDLPVLADLEQLPGPTDRSVRCTNVRTVDGKRPAFVHDVHGMFVLPLSVIRLIEAPAEETAPSTPPTPADEVDISAPAVPDEEPEEDLLARIRSV